MTTSGGAPRKKREHLKAPSKPKAPVISSIAADRISATEQSASLKAEVLQVFHKHGVGHSGKIKEQLIESILFDLALSTPAQAKPSEDELSFVRALVDIDDEDFLDSSYLLDAIIARHIYTKERSRMEFVFEFHVEDASKIQKRELADFLVSLNGNLAVAEEEVDWVMSTAEAINDRTASKTSIIIATSAWYANTEDSNTVNENEKMRNLTRPWEEEANILKTFRKYDLDATGLVNVKDLISVLEQVGVPRGETQVLIKAMTGSSSSVLIRYTDFINFVFGNSGLKAVFFDFDETLTSPQYIEHKNSYALSDRPGLCNSLSMDEVVANFGGMARISRLAVMLGRLQDAEVAVFIVSLGWTNVILKHLSMVGLVKFFHPSRVHGKDSQPFTAAGHSKAKLIARLRDDQGWESARCLFVDDNEENIKNVKHKAICRTLHVAGDGLCEDEMRGIESFVW